MGVGLVEHLFFILNSVYQAKHCTGFAEAPLKYYSGVSFPNFFTLIAYTHWAGAIIKFSNTISTFAWIFTDLLITLISIALTERFKQIVRRLENNKVMHEKFWKEIRQDYQRLYHLSKTVEKHMALLVLISYIHNIFFLCIQLYNSIRERTGIIESVYFFYSFGFLVLRLLVISMYGAWLNDEARKPLDILYAVPSEHYCTEINRLIEQIYTNPVGITGSGFFLVTKNFLLQMAGTIVTFELMIFQFAQPVKTTSTTSTNITYNCNVI
ncbi:gustatory receptor for sugar taste 64e-like [Anoplophora glabripennis]|nr:gustatory receptor for sugar taste 64e-like [Anoplophora glabripennis]